MNIMTQTATQTATQNTTSSMAFLGTNLRERIKNEVNSPIISPDFELVRDASKLRAEAFRNDKGTSLSIDLGNGLTHVFDAKSRISKRVGDTPIELIEQQLRKGAFFFAEIDNKMQLVDLVMDQNRFIHSDENIKSMIDLLGISSIPNKQSKHLHRNTQLKTHYLGRAYSTSDLHFEHMNGKVEGGEFNSMLRFLWSPFSSHINTAFELIRLICANGMVGLASFLNAKVPLINMWQQNMDIAAKQIQNAVDAKFEKRFLTMSNTATSVGVLMNIGKHIEERLYAHDLPDTERALLNGLMQVVDPIQHVGHVYSDRVFTDNNVAQQCPAHLSKMDTYNIVTELSSHTSEADNSSDNALQKIANALMWTERDFKTSRLVDKPFNSADDAFFGLIV